ncbi:MAG: hypothetical protein C0498_13590 [Anaerolinea sp.]|uniref:hypothetical protein n=2 Tax=Sphingomonas sp. TaxID=28214 RepID=UPI001DD5C89B|nr:hypothetical protein [Anaerolinea sp.]MBA4210804.1 hypothetical protein [Parvibaculum sp.]
MKMDDLDMALARLAHAPIPASLDGLEDRVLARIGAIGSTRGPSLMLAGGGAAIFALILGVTMGADLPRREVARQDVAGLFGEPPYALSTLFGA